MEELVVKFEESLRSIRTHGAASQLVEDVKVNYFSKETPLKQLAHIGKLSAEELAVEPWDKNTLGDIELALRNSNLQLAVVNDGRRLLIKFPPLTTENRQEMIKNVEQKSEEAKITLRVSRGETWDRVQTLEKKGDITEDDKYDFKRDLDKLIAEFNQKIDRLGETKTREILG